MVNKFIIHIIFILAPEVVGVDDKDDEIDNSLHKDNHNAKGYYERHVQATKCMVHTRLSSTFIDDQLVTMCWGF